jgi:hypothetical protein
MYRLPWLGGLIAIFPLKPRANPRGFFFGTAPQQVGAGETPAPTLKSRC